jgi:hypothetical protein
MTREESIIEFGAWLQTAPGRYLLDWEQARLDGAVADAFGFHALQLGLPEIDGLRANRMPHRWVAADSLYVPDALPLPPLADDTLTSQAPHEPVALHCEFDALPLPDASIDLVVLVPEGRVVIAGLNPASLWGLRQRAGRMTQGLGLRRGQGLFLPRAGEFIGYWRLRDWLRLLGFEVEAGRFGCWRPPFGSQKWLDRFAWIDPVADRWWPVLGSVYFVVAVKRVRGMRLIGLAKPAARKAQAAPAAVANRSRSPQPVAGVKRSHEAADMEI